MKFYILILIINLLYIDSKYPLRNLKLYRNPIVYQKLAQAAKDTVYQVYNITIDFKNRSEAAYEDSSKKIMVVVDEYSPIIPQGFPNITFNVKNGEPMISKELTDILDTLSLNKKTLKVFFVEYDVKESFKALVNKVAAGFNNGEVYIYELDIEKTHQIRYKCFLSENEISIGAFEIIQQDKDKSDFEHIVESIKKWMEIIKPIIASGAEITENVGKIVSSFVGIWTNVFKAKKENISLFLKSPIILLIYLFI